MIQVRFFFFFFFFFEGFKKNEFVNSNLIDIAKYVIQVLIQMMFLMLNRILYQKVSTSALFYREIYHNINYDRFLKIRNYFFAFVKLFFYIEKILFLFVF